MALTFLDASLGAMLVGVMVLSTLFGIVIAQTHAYFRTYENDPAWLKTMVGGILALELGHTICVCHSIYVFAVTDYGNPTALIYVPQSLGASIIIEIALKVIYDAYYLYRIFRLTSNKLAVGTAVLFNIPSVALSVAVGVQSLTLDSFLEFTKRMDSMVIAVFALSFAIDSYISAVLISWLARKRQGVSEKCEVKALDRVFLWAAQTGLIASLNYIACLVTHSLMPSDFIYVAFYINQPKLYSNCLLASLNARMVKTDEGAAVYTRRDDFIAGRYSSTPASENITVVEYQQV